MNECFLCSCMAMGSSFEVEQHTHRNEIVVPIDQEPSHRYVLKSESLRVFDAFFPPDEASLYHSHEKDSVLVCIDGGDVTSEEPGKPLVPRPPIPSRHIYYRPYAQTPLIHRVRNLSSTPFRILDIEVLKDRDTPLSLPELPEIFEIVIDNDRVRVARLTLSPGQTTGEISFLSSRLLTAFDSGKIRISFDLQVQHEVIDVAPGTLKVQEKAGKETITNIGTTLLELVCIEIK